MAAVSRDVYVYFDNDVKVRAPFDALNLEALLQGAAPIPFPRGRWPQRRRRGAAAG